ncbi:LLM class flavin-dependent oxidoreductase [Wielerella bovis]|uniref:LLM class flavin-dependent oxidoreductase n=1 Tax=Wielerella bovis TaxID=2917790 RepID=UPI0020186EEC|nr:LLM class flavin-dependent oxidoreductase [Wielerella bovis]ULJ59703.1 LLM class flavin-dependent oxidoreductase [Wielerella bovis]
MSNPIKIPQLSALNLAPMRQGQNARQAIDAMVRLAQHLEHLDFKRFWIAEHHNMPHLASSATQILIAHTLSQTQKIRVGSGGVMLPNHSPLQVAEQYGTLETLHPNRVDLGLGRAPGTDPMTAMALRRGRSDISDQFPNDIADLQRYFGNGGGDNSVQGQVKAYPALGLNVPLYILGSSTESAYLAGRLGLPYAFASHFAPRMLDMAVDIYRNEFKPSAVLNEPYMMICNNILVADSDDEAKFLATTQQQLFWDLVRGVSRGMCPPVPDMDTLWSPQEKLSAQAMMSTSLIGDKDSVKQQLIDFQQKYQADELIAINYIFDEQKQHHAYTLLKQIIETI